MTFLWRSPDIQSTGIDWAHTRERIWTSGRSSRVSSTPGRRMCTSSCLLFCTCWGVLLGRVPRRCVYFSGGRQSARRSSLWQTWGMVLGQTTVLVRWWGRRSVLSADGMHACCWRSGEQLRRGPPAPVTGPTETGVPFAGDEGVRTSVSFL